MGPVSENDLFRAGLSRGCLRSVLETAIRAELRLVDDKSSKINGRFAYIYIPIHMCVCVCVCVCVCLLRCQVFKVSPPNGIV